MTPEMEGLVAVFRAAGVEVEPVSDGVWRIDGAEFTFTDGQLREYLRGSIQKKARKLLHEHLVDAVQNAIRHLRTHVDLEVAADVRDHDRKVILETIIKSDDEDFHFHIQLSLWKCDGRIIEREIVRK